MGRNSGEGDDNTNSAASKEEKPNVGFDTVDVVNVLPPFAPPCQPGVHFEAPTLMVTMFFHLFFTPQMISAIVEHTNTYGTH